MKNIEHSGELCRISLNIFTLTAQSQGKNCKWKRRTRKIWSMQALVMNTVNTVFWELWDVKQQLAFGSLDRVWVGFFLEELKVKIPDARLHMSFNLAGKILTPLNLSSLAGSSAPSCMCSVRTHWGQPSKIDKLKHILKQQPSVTSSSTWKSTNLIFASTF